MTITLFNTVGGSLQEFEPLHKDNVNMYHCGPTVYARPHIGNLRTYISWDILRRMFEDSGYTVNQVINITDVGHLVSDEDDGEDKMTKGLRREGMSFTLESMKSLGEKYAQEFMSDLRDIGNLKPSSIPRASDYIDDNISIIRLLEQQGFTYVLDDGLYFDTSKDPHYGMKLKGALGSQESEDEHRRIHNTSKKSSKDFALWKFNADMGWDSPWGKGFPGWHIECSAMCSAHFGPSFDIHTGGKDHIPVHHTNEIAQSENAFGLPMARYWLHANFLTIKDEKIAKSLQNDITLPQIVEKGFSPRAFRYFCLGAHYRSELSFSWESLQSAEVALDRLRDIALKDFSEDTLPDQDSILQMRTALQNDLNTPQALSVLWNTARGSLPQHIKSATLLFFDALLGLGIGEYNIDIIPERISELVKEREDARARKDYQQSDAIRAHIEELGYTLEDGSRGVIIKKKRVI